MRKLRYVRKQTRHTYILFTRRQWGVYMIKSGKHKEFSNMDRKSNLFSGGHLENTGKHRETCLGPCAESRGPGWPWPPLMGTVVRAQSPFYERCRTFFSTFLPACRSSPRQPAPSERTPCGHAPGKMGWSAAKKVGHCLPAVPATFRHRFASGIT